MADAPTLREVRGATAAYLFAQTGHPVHASPPATPTPPCAVLVPGSPWLDFAGFRMGRRVTVRLDLVALAAPQDNDGTLDLLETMTTDLVGALDAYPGVSTGEVSPPTLITVGASELLGVVAPFTLITRHPENPS